MLTVGCWHCYQKQRAVVLTDKRRHLGCCIRCQLRVAGLRTGTRKEAFVAEDLMKPWQVSTSEDHTCEVRTKAPEGTLWTAGYASWYPGSRLAVGNDALAHYPEPHLDVGRSGRVVCVPSLVRDCSRRKVLDPWSGYALIVSCPWPMYQY